MIKNCLTCGKDTDNPKFCNHSCSAKYTNKNRIIINSLKKEYFCFICKKSMGIGRKNKRKYCISCKKEYSPNYKDWSLVTIEQHFKNLPNFQANSRIRALGKGIYKKSKKNFSCLNCGYSKHVEICHIKPISSFDRNTTISQVNDINNLVALCPNCHWELDNGFLKLPEK